MSKTDLRTYDIHLASDVLSEDLSHSLNTLGFKRDAFIGGTTGVFHPQHLSVHPQSMDHMRELWSAVTQLLRRRAGDEFFGYAEAEITPPRFRATFGWRPLDKSVPVPLKSFSYEECPSGEYKDVDIHLTLDLESMDPCLKTVLEQEINFHYVDILRPSQEVVRVYTVQPLGIRGVSRLYRTIRDYIQMAGGARGKLKLEATYAYERFPKNAPVCPILTSWAGD